MDDLKEINISAGAVSGDTFCADVVIFIQDDDILESLEVFNVSLFSISPCGFVGQDTTIVEIINDDSKSTFKLLGL